MIYIFTFVVVAGFTEILEFSVVPEQGLTTDDNITMSCTLSSLFKSFNITNKITIFDHTGSVLKVGDVQEEIQELERVYTSTSLTFIPEKSGKVTYNCLWNYDVEYDGTHYNGSLQKNLSLRIYGLFVRLLNVSCFTEVIPNEVY